MADGNKSKLQLRSGGLSINGDKTPSPATKLLINHGKPNFTIQRSHNKIQNGNVKPTSPPPATTGNFQNNNNNEFVVKSTTFNGVFKPSNMSAVAKQTLPQNGNTYSKNDNDNEAAKVVLRRPKVAQVEMREREDDDNVPEFIRRQRRIQERLANQNILDFENRRSGYFTQVMISPSSPNRQSFVETMARPAVKPGLEMPAPAAQHEDSKIETASKEQEAEQTPPPQNQYTEIENDEAPVKSEPVTPNGQVEEEEVAKAIEEVNKAVEGEDDDKIEIEEHQISQQMKENDTLATAVSELKVEETEPKRDEKPLEEYVTIEHSTTEENSIVNPVVTVTAEVAKEQTYHEMSQEETVHPTSLNGEVKVKEPKSNDHVHEEHHQSNEKLDNDITISHVNGINGPSIPAPDPSGEKGVNFETKTVVSFSQELGNDDNKYPDTVKVVKEVEAPQTDSELKELTKLKFEIKADNQDIEVKPVLVNEAV